MSKKRARQQKKQQVASHSRRRRRTVIIIGLILCLTLSGGILANWRTLSPAPQPPLPTPGSLAATSPSKEYIYAGGRLIATEEPLASPTQSPTPTPSASPTPTPPPSGGGVENVVWANISGATAATNNLTKTAAFGWGNSGASSTRAISSGDGFVEIKATETTTSRMFGLSNGDTDQNWQEIDYAIYVAGDSNLYIYEAGNYLGAFGSYAQNDLLRVAIESGSVRYKRNGVEFYSHTTQPTYPLLLDTALAHTGATITNAVISGSLQNVPQNVVWTSSTSNVTIAGNSLTKTAGSAAAWDGGAVSTSALLSGDGSLEFTASENSTDRIVGFSHSGAVPDYWAISFGIRQYYGTLYIIENGGENKGAFGAYSSGDKLKIEIVSGVVRYYKNGTLLYTSLFTPTYTLKVDACLFDAGATINNVTISGTLTP